jgi:hypothetical protein
MDASARVKNDPMSSMEPNSKVSVYEPEMDMNRCLGLTPAGRMKRLISTLLWLRSNGYEIGPPRRSVDRKQQEHSPPCEL